MIDYFIGKMSGIDTQPRDVIWNDSPRKIRRTIARDRGIVRQPVDEGTLRLADDFALARPLTAKPLKFTLTGRTCSPKC